MRRRAKHLVTGRGVLASPRQNSPALAKTRQEWICFWLIFAGSRQPSMGEQYWD
ncbi:hypothetical protein A2U01_0104661 [Trifolium medium]|uniref:Uncharacterized protein n=1 Tax=Trifolium medium TaxID=97028 RepID=A0A392V960_9FABA|nr:hypothetical protein [Trifolium medium]